jgi:hypothetical protein
MVRRRPNEVFAKAASMILLVTVTGLIVFDSFREPEHSPN